MDEAVVKIIADYVGGPRLAFVGYLTRAAQRCGLSAGETMQRAARMGEVRQPSDSTWPKPRRYYVELT